MYIIGSADVGVDVTRQLSMFTRASATINMSLKGTSTGGVNHDSGFHHLMYLPDEPGSCSRHASAQVSFLNTDDAAVVGEFALDVQAWARASGVPPVPDPAGGTLLLAGLGLLGWRRRAGTSACG